MTAIEWIQAVVGALAGLAGAWTTWSKLWVGKVRPILRRRKARHDIAENALTFNRTQVALTQWRVRSGAMRGLCLTARNCGSHWDPQKQVTIDVIAEAHEDRVPRIFGRWQQWTADPPYRQLLAEIIAAKERGVLITTEGMADSVLRDYYRDQGVVASVVFKIAITAEAELVYVSLNFGQPRKGQDPDKEPLTDEQVNEHIESARAAHRNPETVRRMVIEGQRIWERV